MESNSESLRCMVRSLRITSCKISGWNSAIRAFAPPNEKPWNDESTTTRVRWFPKDKTHGRRVLSAAAGGSYEEPKHTADVCYRGFQKKMKRFLWFLTPRGKMSNFVRNLQNTLQNLTNFWRAFLRFYSIWLKCKQIFDGLMMGFLHPKRGLRIWSKIEWYFLAHLVWWARILRLYYLWLLYGA